MLSSTRRSNSRAQNLPQQPALLEELLSENVDPKVSASRFLEPDLYSWERRERMVVELMFYCGGCYKFDYGSYLQSIKHALRHLGSMQKPPQKFSPPASDDVFMSKLNIFIREIFSSIQPREEIMDFVDGLKKAVKLMIKGVLDSARRVATCVGLVLMSYSQQAKLNILVHLRSTPNDDPGALALYENLSVRLVTLWDNLITRFFDVAYRDKSRYIRQAVFREMYLWAISDRFELLQPRWTRAILLGLCDCPEWMLRVTKLLYEADFNSGRQRTLLEKIFSTLVKILPTERGWPLLAMEILSSASRCLDLETMGSDHENQIIFMCVYNKNHDVGVEAAKYVLHTAMKAVMMGPATTLLLDLVVFNHEAEIQSAELLVDSFFALLKESVSWEDWENLFKSSPPEHLVGCFELFYSYVRKAVTDFFPNGRTRGQTLQSLSKSDMDAACNSFTSFMSGSWRNILEEAKVRVNPTSQVFFLKSMEFLNESLASRTAIEIISFLGELLRFTEDVKLIDSCWSTISFLKKTPEYSALTRPDLESVFDAIANNTIRQFFEYLDFPSASPEPEAVGARMVGLTKHGQLIVTSEVWNACARKLDLLLTTSTGSNTPHVTPIQANDISSALKVLYYVVFHHFNVLNLQGEADESNDISRDSHQNPDDTSSTVQSSMPSVLLRRKAKLEKWALTALGLEDLIDVRFLAFSVLVNLTECFGKHMVHHPNTAIMIISSSVERRVEQAIFEFSCEVISSPSLSFAEGGVCCTVLKKVCELMSLSVMPIHGLHILISLATKSAPDTHHHSDIIMKALKKYNCCFPQNKLIIGYCVAAAMNDILSFAFSEQDITESVDRIWNVALKNVKSALDKWTDNCDFRKTIRRAGILASVQWIVQLMSQQYCKPELLSLVTGDEFTKTLSIRDNPSSTRRSATEVDAQASQEGSSLVGPSSSVDLGEDEGDGSSDFSGFSRTPIGHSTLSHFQQPGSASAPR